jgi:hypothetical protein
MFNALPKYSLQQLLLSVSFIAIGISLLTWLIRNAPLGPELSDIPIYIFCWFGGGSFIGAGLCAPFQQARKGAVYGVLVQFLNILLFSLLGIG